MEHSADIEVITLTMEFINMMFKKGDRVQTDDGHVGEILFVDNDGVEAQVALERQSLRLRTDTLKLLEEKNATTDIVTVQRAADKPKRARRAPKK